MKKRNEMNDIDLEERKEFLKSKRAGGGIYHPHALIEMRAQGTITQKEMNKAMGGHVFEVSETWRGEDRI